MAPSAIPATALSQSENTGGLSKARLASRLPNSREPTPTAGSLQAASNADVFRSDLTNIKSLVTCSICDQLLYEPWTLSCGHTYCYSCLCNWFVPNKRKKTCPDCRSSIKQIPAPSFLVKQMVEIFCKRAELMPSDESIEQHRMRRAEEIADMDKDKNSSAGLFKGTFRPSPGVELLYDEGDAVFRCPSCQHEDEGEPHCVNCGAEIDRGEGQYGFSDVDDEDLELDEVELDAYHQEHRGHFHHYLDIPHFPLGANLAPFRHHHHHHFHHDHDSLGETTDSEGNSEDEDEGSLQDFVVHDNDGSTPARHLNQPRVINISDSESDEGGAVSNRRRRPYGSRPSVTPSVLTVSTDSENGDNHDEADMLRGAGWSPLETENESDADEPLPSLPRSVRVPGDHLDSDDESDTNTMRNEQSDEEDDESGSDPSLNQAYHYNAHLYNDTNQMSHFDDLTSESEDEQSEAEFPRQLMDKDGDTEMSASPGPSNSSRGGSVNNNGYDGEGEGDDPGDGTPRQNRGETVSTGYGDMGENLGYAHHIHEIEDDSDDDVRPPPRRRPRQRYGTAHIQQTDPRISMMFAEHQQSLRGASRDVEEDIFDLEDEVRRIESRHRRLTAYRQLPLRRADPLRSSRSPSATRLVSSSNRVARPPRQYLRRHV